MKTKFTLLAGIICLFTVTASYAQLNSFAANSTASADIDGTPFLDENFVPGVIYHDNTSNNIALRYNAYLDVMEYVQNGVNMYLEAGPKISKVSIGATTYMVKKFEYKRQIKYGYLALLDSGKVTLYSKKIISFHKAKQEGAPSFAKIPAGYDRESDVFYYQVGDGELRELESIKSMIATLPEKQEELTLFAKKEKISASKEQKVVKFVQFYNSL